jgi:outer membrane protein OmpA-like peptidoglycan-associated protein
MFICTLVLFAINGCTVRPPHSNYILEQDWESDVYNLVYATFEDLDTLSYDAYSPPSYKHGTMFRTVCVRVNRKRGITEDYMANLDTYSLNRTTNCDSHKSFDLGKDRSNDELSSNDEYRLKIAQFEASNVVYKTDGRHAVLFQFVELFNVNDFKLTSKGVRALEKASEQIKKADVKAILIYGVADSSGGYEFNKYLAKNRSLVVKEFLINQGVERKKIVTRGSVENALKTIVERQGQRRFIIEVSLNES